MTVGTRAAEPLRRVGVRGVATAARAAPEAQRVGIRKAYTTPSGQYEANQCFVKCSDITVAEGKGCYVWDTAGRKYLDATSGIAVLSTGHCHPRVVEAVQAQAATLMHGQLNCFKSHAMMDELVEKFGPTLPEGITAMVFDTTGTQAIEAAVKLARRRTQRPGVVTLHGGFHGRSLLTTAMTSSNAGPRYPLASPLPGNVYQVTPPLAFRWRCSEAEAVNRAIMAFEDFLQSGCPTDQVACVIAESVMGEGGFIPLPAAYMERMRALCDAHGILLISDEVQAGAGRTGKMWGCEHFGPHAQPDILVAAKGIASGMPLSCVAATKDVMDAYVPGSHGGTYGGNPVACAAAHATLQVFEEEGLLENVATNGAAMMGMLKEVQEAYLPESDVRGRGYMVALEFRGDDGEPCAEVGQYVRRHAMNHGVLFYGLSGWYGNCMRLMPPLIATEQETVAIVSAIEAALSDWKRGVKLA
eukprot:TRINITY_DN7_c0_g1_i1.p2 TRINITY_DN7_c0_g1~~TRINITY_DN7_c0_g1_i1.p2  ORF type:complete len:471 (+),score=160.34 TRINITY_DN7_c0_g1_i1:68-1480(+)